MKHQLGEIWKEGRYWKLQAPKGIDTYNTKKMCLLVKDIMITKESKNLDEAMKKYGVTDRNFR